MTVTVEAWPGSGGKLPLSTHNTVFVPVHDMLETVVPPVATNVGAGVVSTKPAGS